MTLSTKGREDGEVYATMTAQRAAAAVESRRAAAR